jgi:hypothetical protein
MRSIPVLAVLALTGCVDPSYRITVTLLAISDDSDSYGTPEIEVYLFDQGGDMLGCAGSRHGTQGVDVAGIRYMPDAFLVDEDSDRDIHIGSGPIRFEVWEDDDDPVCPTRPDPMGNDVLGVAPAMSVGQWMRTDAELAFGAVTAFRVEFD